MLEGSRLMAIHSPGRHPRRCTNACDCLVLHRCVGGRRHVATTSTLPSQSARNHMLVAEIQAGYTNSFVNRTTDFPECRNIQSGDQL